MKYIEAGYTGNELVQYRNDFKAIKIGNDKVGLCEDYANKLKSASYSDKLRMSILLFNETMTDLC